MGWGGWQAWWGGGSLNAGIRSLEFTLQVPGTPWRASGRGVIWAGNHFGRNVLVVAGWRGGGERQGGLRDRKFRPGWRVAAVRGALASGFHCRVLMRTDRGVSEPAAMLPLGSCVTGKITSLP